MRHRFIRNVHRNTVTCYFCNQEYTEREVTQASLSGHECQVSLMELLLRWPPGTEIPLCQIKGSYYFAVIASWAENPALLGTFLDTTGDIQHIEDYHPEYIPQPGH